MTRQPRVQGSPRSAASARARGRLAEITLCAALFAAVALFHVWSHTRVTSSGYRLARVQAEHRRLVAERDRLKLEIETLRAPGRLEAYARARLGMAPPAPGAVVAEGGGGTGDGRAVGRAGRFRPAPAEPLHGGRAAGGEELALRR